MELGADGLPQPASTHHASGQAPDRMDAGAATIILIWMMKAGIVVVVAMASLYWFENDPINRERIILLALVMLPWVAALGLPAAKVEHAFGLLCGGSIVLVPIIVFLAVLSPLSGRSVATDWFLLFAMVATLLMGMVAVAKELRRRSVNVRQAATLLGCAALYELALLKALTLVHA